MYMYESMARKRRRKKHRKGRYCKLARISTSAPDTGTSPKFYCVQPRPWREHRIIIDTIKK